jgi:hypothetical protein
MAVAFVKLVPMLNLGIRFQSGPGALLGAQPGIMVGR